MSYSNNNSTSNLSDPDTRLHSPQVMPLSSSSQQGSPYSRHSGSITPSTSKNQLPKLNTNSLVFNLPASALSTSNMSPTLSAVQSRHKGLPLDNNNNNNNNASASSNIFSQNNSSSNNITSSISHLSLSTTNNNGYSLKLRNLPSDLSTREANAIFSLSTEFIGVEMFFENGNIALLAKFASYNEAASVARILDNKQIFGSNYLPIKAEFENSNNNNPNSSNTNSNNMSSIPKRHTNLTASRSRFIFNNNSSTDFNSNNNNNNNNNNSNNNNGNGNNNGIPDSIGKPIDVLHTPSATTAGKSLLLLETQQDAREYDELVSSPWATSAPTHSALSSNASSQQQTQQTQQSSSIMLGSHNASNVSLSNHSTTSINGASSSSIAANTSSLDINTTITTTAANANISGPQPGSATTNAQPSTPIGGYEWGMGSSSASQDGFFSLNKTSHTSHPHLSHLNHHQHLNQHLNHHQSATGLSGLSINTSIAAGNNNNNNGSLVGTPLTATPLTAVPLQTPNTAGPPTSATNSLGSVAPQQQQPQSQQQSNGSMVDATNSVGNGSTSVDLSLLARVPLPSNPADQNPPCNTLYVGNLPPDATEAELRALFSPQQGFRRLSFKNKAASNSGQNGNNAGSNTGGSHGPMCFVEFEDVAYATKALAELYGSYLPRPTGMSNNKGGIRLSFSKNPLGVRGPGQRRGSSNYAYNSSNNNSMYSQQQQQQQQQQVPLTPSTPHGILPPQTPTSMHLHQQQQYIPSQQQQAYQGYQQHSHF